VCIAGARPMALAVTVLQMNRGIIMEKQLDPHTTICVCYVNSKRVGSIPATAPNASEYLTKLAILHGVLDIEYEQDTAAAMYGRRC
jgi:hypothetical protein